MVNASASPSAQSPDTSKLGLGCTKALWCKEPSKQRARPTIALVVVGGVGTPKSAGRKLPLMSFPVRPAYSSNGHQADMFGRRREAGTGLDRADVADGTLARQLELVARRASGRRPLSTGSDVTDGRRWMPPPSPVSSTPESPLMLETV
jgi:hypothetical protein